MKHPGSCQICDGQLDKTVTGIFDTRFGIDGELDVYKCERCGVESTLPAPESNELKELYENFYNFEHHDESGSKYQKARQALFSSAAYRVWMALDGDISFHARKGSGRLLDVGCNEGRGMEIMRANGYSCTGLELNSVAAQTAREKGFTVESKLLEDYAPDDPYDVVVLSNVIEHARNPGLMLENIHRVLNPSGEVWISCPNSKSVFRTLFGKRWINWHPPFHLFHFDGGNLSRLLGDHGFQATNLRTRSPAIWVTQSILSRVFSKQGTVTVQMRNPWLVGFTLVVTRFLLFPFLFVLNQSGKGDCLIVTARKRA